MVKKNKRNPTDIGSDEENKEKLQVKDRKEKQKNPGKEEDIQNPVCECHDREVEILSCEKIDEALRKNEEMFRTIVDKTNDGILIFDTVSEKFIYSNPAICRILGYTPEEFANMGIPDIHPKEHLDDIMDKFERFRSGEDEGFVEIPCIRKDGNVRTMNISSTRTMLMGGMCMVGIFTDITDRKKAEEKLRESEGRFSQVAENAREWIWEVDADGLYIYASPAVERILGYMPEEIVDRKHFYDFFSPKENGELKQTALEQFSSKESFVGFVNRNLHKNGNLVILETSGTPHLDDEGRLIGYRGVDTDITERLQAENALRKSEEIFRNLVENISDVIFSLNLEGEITYISPVVEGLYGYKPDEVVGQKFSIFVHPDDLPAVIEGFKKRIRGEYKENIFRINDVKGREHHVRTTLTPITDDGAVTGFNYIMTDFTERKRAEEALKETNRKLNMLSTITRHDILNMIMVIREYLEMSEETGDDTVIRGYMMKEKEAVNAIQNQIEFTRYYQDIGVEEPGWQDMGIIVGEAVKQLDLAGINMENSLKGLEIFADPLTGKVFYNLMENSLRHGEHVTEISISSSKTGDGLTISYRDNGVGIGEEDKKKLFTRGFGKNTGLGLFLSREILSITGITIEENGEPGKGVNFEIRVPEGKFRLMQSKGGTTHE